MLGVRAWSLLRPLPQLFSKNILTPSLSFPFSEFFDKQDTKELNDAFSRHYTKQFLHYKLTDHWKKKLQRKQRRKQRKAQIQHAKEPPQNQIQKLVVHNPAVGIEYPPKSQEVFAVVQVDGFQYKVLEDAVLLLDTKKQHKINQTITFKSVPLIGTKSYTLVGRPNVTSALVQAIVESISDSKKVIVFKKKRRKNYKRSFGMRSSLTQCRIIRIVHHLSEEVQGKAIAL